MIRFYIPISLAAFASILCACAAHAGDMKPSGFKFSGIKSDSGGGGGGWKPPVPNTPVLIHPGTRNGPSRQVIHYKIKREPTP